MLSEFYSSMQLSCSFQERLRAELETLWRTISARQQQVQIGPKYHFVGHPVPVLEALDCSSKLLFPLEGWEPALGPLTCFQV